MSTLFTEGLDKTRLVVFEKLAVFADEFVLAGGTALMLQINHRKSYDFDCFSEEPLKKNLLRKCEGVFGKDLQVRTNTSDLLLFKTKNNIQIDFVYYPYSHLHPLIKKAPIRLFDIADLATNKAHTVGRRGMWRDYVDLFFLFKWELFSVQQIVEEAEKRFKPEFNDKLFLERLCYFGDLEIVEIEFLQESYTPEEIMEFLNSQVNGETKERLKRG